MAEFIHNNNNLELHYSYHITSNALLAPIKAYSGFPLSTDSAMASISIKDPPSLAEYIEQNRMATHFRSLLKPCTAPHRSAPDRT